MSIFHSLVKKEALHIVRDTRTMVIIIIMPLVLLLLFGYAISTEVNDIRVVAVVDQQTEEIRDIIQRLKVNEYITFQGLATHEDTDRLLRSGTSDAVLLLRYDAGLVKTQILVDASNTNMARTAAAYIRSIIAGQSGHSPLITSTLYNPQLKSSYNFVPGILGMIFILICAIMSSVSIVREKETGTMNLLLVSPVRPRTIILGKLLPYFILSSIILALMLLMSYTVLGLPVSSSVVKVIGVSMLYIILSLSIGLLVSTIVATQLSALIVSAVMFMLPVIMLSGMIFPIDNMPVALQWISSVIPARWYIEAMRKLMVQQLGLGYIYREVIILSSMTVLFLTLAIIKFKSSTK
ncbi:MAG: ABC transporter permease [Muribaculaceae bacterium]|nr:ABC transporter permease [Muribaculaceae bacterium]